MIYITGDTHIPFDIKKLNTRTFPAQKELCKSDYVIICGDFGGVMYNDREELYWRKWLAEKRFTTLFVDGNHENFESLCSFDMVEFCGAKARKISNSIFHLQRGQVYKIDGKTFFTFGGGESHDKEYRTPFKDWWEQELPSDSEIQTAWENLKAADYNVDYIITHSAPSSIQDMIKPEYPKNVLTDFLEDVKNKVSFKKWFFGHYHTDKVVDEKLRCVFYDIVEL